MYHGVTCSGAFWVCELHCAMGWAHSLSQPCFVSRCSRWAIAGMQQTLMGLVIEWDWT
jgi:hypothetical protein